MKWLTASRGSKNSSFPRRREPISLTNNLCMPPVMGPRLRGEDERMVGFSVVLPVLFLVSACGLHPLYAGGGNGAVAQGLAAIDVSPIEGRAGWLMLIGSVSSLIDNVLKLVISRQRPPADLVHILDPTTGFSYPSGHAVFFTWLGFMLAFSLAPRVGPLIRPVLWIAAGALIMLTCIARVWAGDHWPSDVIGGVLLGVGWSAFVLWLPERWLPSPSWNWFRGRSRPAS